MNTLVAFTRIPQRLCAQQLASDLAAHHRLPAGPGCASASLTGAIPRVTVAAGQRYAALQVAGDACVFLDSKQTNLSW